MLHSDRITLRALRRDDLPHLLAFNNDLAVELAGGGDPPMPQSLERLQAEFDQNGAAVCLESLMTVHGESQPSHVARSLDRFWLQTGHLARNVRSCRR